jgi:Flp pilus assembly protein TadG
MQPSETDMNSSRGVLRRLGRWRRDQHGTTAVEFGFVGVPFLMLCFGVITVGLHFLTTYWLENAVERASRKIRTGEAQSTTAPMSIKTFRESICDPAGGSFIDCSKLKIHVQSWADLASVQPKACLDGAGGLSGSTGSDTDNVSAFSGGANSYVLVTVCYEWELASRLPFLRLGKMNNGSALIQAATTFKTEPFQ